MGLNLLILIIDANDFCIKATEQKLKKVVNDSIMKNTTSNALNIYSRWSLGD